MPTLKELQQALSEKFGIPTFDVTGAVSTIPTTRPLDPSINVGVGSTGLDLKTFNDLISRFTPQTPTVKTVPVFTPNLGQITIQPEGSKLLPGETVVPESTNNQSFTGSVSQGFNQLIRKIGPTGLIIGGAILVLIALKK